MHIYYLVGVLMALDIVGGVLAAMMGKSNKTDTGTLSSKAMRDGLLHKAGECLVVIAGCALDWALGTDCVAYGSAVCIICAELLSLIETLGLMGVPIPSVIKRVIDVLREEDGEGR